MSRRHPNGYGCVTMLKGNRARPWCVKVTTYDANGHGKQTPIAYAATKEEALIVLAQYNHNPWNIERDKITLAVLYQRFSEVKMPKLGDALQSRLKSGYKHCAKYYGVKYRTLRAYQMQDCIDNCGYGYSTQGAIKTLWGHLDRFAFELDVIDKMYSELTTAEPIPETSKMPFTSEQISALWRIQDEPWVNTVLIYLYTGFRLNELLQMKTEQVNTDEWYFTGGSKTGAGKGRIVPVHERIKPLVQELVDQGNPYLFSRDGKIISKKYYYKVWNEVMQKIGSERKPHEVRHTLETALDNAKGNKKCIDMIMGHKSKDVGNRVYNHKTIEQLRETINLME